MARVSTFKLDVVTFPLLFCAAAMSYGRQAVVPAPAMDSPRRLVPAESLASLSASSRFKRAPSWDISQPSGLRAGPCGNCDRWPLPNPITMNNAPSPRLDGSPRLGVGRKGVFSTPPSWSIDKGSQTRRLRETEVPTWSPHLNQPQHRTIGTPFALYGASSSPRQNRHHASVASLQPTRPAGFGFQPVPLRYALTPSQPKPKRIVVPPKTQHWLVDQRGNELDEYDPFVALPIVDGLLAADEEVFQANVDQVFIESNVDEDGWLGRTEVHAAVNLLCSRIGMRRLPEERIDEIIRSCNSAACATARRMPNAGQKKLVNSRRSLKRRSARPSRARWPCEKHAAEPCASQS